MHEKKTEIIWKYALGKVQNMENIWTKMPKYGQICMCKISKICISHEIRYLKIIFSTNEEVVFADIMSVIDVSIPNIETE